MESEYISMFPGHKLVLVYGMHDMSLEHIDTFTFCINPHPPPTPVCYGTWVETDYISMSPEHKLVPVHGMRDMSLGHMNKFTFCIKTPVCHGAWLETDYISMCPGHELVPVHGMRDMSLGHSDTFIFCIVPGTWISSCSWHAWYVTWRYRQIYILYQNPPYVMAPGWRLIIFPCPGTWIIYLLF